VIFDAHFSRDPSRTFFHSSSYTANPIACAAAKANLDLWSDPAILARVACVAAMQEKALAPFRISERFSNVRRTGTITALDLDVRDAGYLADIGPRLLAFFGDRNLLLRPLGNTIYVMPPYCVTQADLDEIYAAIAEAASL
jgi:adenosylmethionine-8-amino-7-oxononanoate aminotransferase